MAGGTWRMSRDANARGRQATLGHLRGLDGVRAFSVLAIIAYHSDIPGVPGGFYGVDSFFVLSGFLITSLLLAEWGSSATIRLRSFWARRARRLLPALFVLVAVIGLFMAAEPAVLATAHPLGDALAAVFYSSNWYSVDGGVSYFSAISNQPSPLLHTWSLAIEEQFYLVWPIVVLVVLTLGVRRWGRRGAAAGGPEAPDPVAARRNRLRILFAVACIGSLASALVMAAVARPGDTARAYYGTDTRAQALLVGAAIAIGLTLWPRGSHRPWFTRAAAIGGVAGALGTGAIWATTAETSRFAFDGGFLVASLAAGCVVLGCAAAPRSPVVRLLELKPLPYVGRISYGVYLWYWPVLLVMSAQRLPWGVFPLFMARVAVTVAIASASYYLVEMPVRRGALGGWRSWVAAPVAAGAAVGAVFVASLVPVAAVGLHGRELSASGPRPATAASVTSYFTPSPLPASAAAKVPITRPVKVLLVGDSVAGTLGAGLAASARQHHVQLVNEGIGGCSLSMQNQIKVLFYTVPPGSPCAVGGDAGSLLAKWRTWVDAYNPDVVLYVARGETFDQEIGGQWQNLGQPSFDAYVANRFRSAINVLGSRGATVVLLTTPYYDSGEVSQTVWPAGDPWPEDTPARVVVDNQILRSVVATYPPAASRPPAYLFDLNALISPGGRYSETVGPYSVRCADGVHFTRSGGIYVGSVLAPELAVLGQSHAAASPGGKWPGTPPPTTPTWFAKLPCGG